MIKNALAICWFRRDLRLSDNAALYKALSLHESVLPLFIFDPGILDALPPCDRRVDFIQLALCNIQAELLKLGSSLLVLHKNPLAAFKEIIAEYKVTAVYTNHDYEPYAIQRDALIAEFLASNGIQFHTSKDQVIFEKEEVVKSNGEPYTVFTPYAVAWKKKLEATSLENFSIEKLIGNLYKSAERKIPDLDTLGFRKTDMNFHLPQLDENLISNYHLNRNFPAIDGTTRLGLHLRFGTISIRYLVQKAISLNETWLNELIWREFFMCILFHFPRTIDNSFKTQYDRIAWINNEQDFNAWCNGITGYPMVDAGMRELNETGFMHNRVRMVTASFLTKHLLIDWRWGERYFAEKLLDYECASNVGNWQWAAGSGCDAAPYFRIFNPYEQTKKFDPDLTYIQRWVPELNSHEYPAPVVEHSFARERALRIYKKGISG